MDEERKTSEPSWQHVVIVFGSVDTVQRQDDGTVWVEGWYRDGATYLNGEEQALIPSFNAPA